MNKLHKNLIATALIAPVSFSAWAANNANGTMQNGSMGMMGHSSCQMDASQIELRVLSQEETDSLKYMREEEKLARDVYQVLYEQTFAMVFGNIAQSEQQHMDKVKLFLDAYRIDDPAQEEPGKFTDEILQTLYDDLIAQGSVSELEAFKVGALVEEVDIQDLDVAIENTEIAELKAMYTNLRDASYKHLRAFTKKIIAIDGSYTAQILGQDAVDTILSAPNVSMEMGNAKLINDTGESSSNSCFISELSVDQQAVQNGSSISETQLVSISYQVQVDATEVGQTADWIMLAKFAEVDGADNWFVRNGEQWLSWDGKLGNMPAAAADYVLEAEQTIPVFQGTFNGMPGSYTIYIGYRLEDNSLIYKQAPLVFTVE